MPNAEPRANYCSLWSGSNLWNIWVNYLPPLARLSQVSWPWHALFMFNIIMKSPLCKLCNYFKWSYNNVRHLTGCSSQNKIQPSWFRGGLSNSNLSILRNCTMIHSWCGPVKIHRIATIVSRERIESFIMDKQIKTKYVVSTDFVLTKHIFAVSFDFQSPSVRWPELRWPEGRAVSRRLGPSLLSPQSLSRGLTLTRLTSPRTELKNFEKSGQKDSHACQKNV